MKSKNLTHIDENGRARMVDISAKNNSERMCIAKGEIILDPSTIIMIRDGNVKKGSVLSVAQLAGIMAAKRTADLIPLCHPLQLSVVDVTLEVMNEKSGIMITSLVKTTGKTGVEMEALTAVSVAALTVYDMVKAVDKTMCIQNIRLVEKHGGKSGDVYND